MLKTVSVHPWLTQCHRKKFCMVSVNVTIQFWISFRRLEIINCNWIISDAVKAVNPYLNRIPESLHEDYHEDCKAEIFSDRRLSILEETGAVSVSYTLMTVFASKPANILWKNQFHYENNAFMKLDWTDEKRGKLWFKMKKESEQGCMIY